MAPTPDDSGRPRDGASRRKRGSPSSSSGSGSSSSGSSSDSSSSSDSGSDSPPRNLRGSKERTDERLKERVKADGAPEGVAVDLPAPGPAHRSDQDDRGDGEAPQLAEAPDQARRSVFDRMGGAGGGSGREGDRRQQLGERERGRDDDRGRGNPSDGDRYDNRRGSRYDGRQDRDRDGGHDRYQAGGDRCDDDRYGSRRDRPRDDGHDRRRNGGDGYDAGDRWRGDREDVEPRRGNDRQPRRDPERGRDSGRDRDRDRGRDSEREREPDGDRSPRKRRREDDDNAEREQQRRPVGAAGGREGADAGPGGGGAAGDKGEATDAAAAGGDAAAPAAAPAEEPVVRKVVPLGKTGGVYIPPFKLARMMADQGAQDKASPEYQRLTWEALKKSLNGIINKINVVNVKNILPEVFRENLIRGRGLLCRSLMKSQAASPSFTAVYAAMLAVVNTKFPEMGELLLSRLILQFKRSFKRNDKPVCTAASKFIAHLVNQGVAHEVLALEVLILLLEVPSEDSVEMAVEFVREVGAHLQEVAPQGLHGVFERFRAILHEGAISKRVQFIIEGMFAVRKAGFEASGFPAVKPELDLVEAEDQITHEMGLDDQLQAQTNLDVFRVDPDYEEEERKYATIAKEILGDEEADAEAQEAGGAGGSEQADEEESDGDEDGGDEDGGGGGSGGGGIHDETATNLVNLRRTIYLTLMSSFDFEEAGHKLLKIGIQPGQEIELVTMIIECCSQERTFKRFYGLLAQRFCYLSRAYAETFEDCFRKQYSVIHRLETNKLRNVSCLFAHLLATDALPWSALLVVRLTEEETTSSSRIFIKYLFQELSSTMGLVKLNQRLNDPAFMPWFEGLFPRDSLQNMRFAINFFTSIGLGGVTDAMRDNYKAGVAIQAAAQQQQVARRMLGSGSGSGSSDSDSSSSSDDSSSSSSSGSDSDSDSSRGRRGGAKAKASKKKKKGGSSKGGKGDKKKSKKSRDKKRR